MAPREGLELELMKLGCTGPPPCRRPQASKAGDPLSQNTDSKGKETVYFVKIYPSEASPSWATTMVG